MNKECIEIVVYTIHPEKISQFLAAREQILKEVKRFEGFISAITLRSTREESTFLDYFVWEGLEQAKKAFDQFQTLPSAKAFMESIQEIKFSDHMKIL